MCDEVGVSACSNLFINHASCIPSLFCLPFFLYHPYNPLLNSQDFLFTPFIFIYILLRVSERGQAPININNREKCVLSSQCVPSFISMYAAVSKFEEKCLKLFEQYVVVTETCSCHGNDVIRMCTKFHL